MTEQERSTFTAELIDAVKSEILAKIPKMPDEWDGHELRVYIAEQFMDAATMSRVSREPRARQRYNRDVISNNL